MHSSSPRINLADTVLRRARLNPERTALVFEGTEQTFAEFASLVRKQATLLRESGVCCGDRVGFVGFNQPAFLETMFAANAIGAIFVPLNFRLTGNELTFIINDAGIHSLIVDDALQPVVEGVREQLCCQNLFSAESTFDNWRGLKAERGAAEELAETVSVQNDDVAIIMYTSGTTGLPKGAMLTHGNIIWNNINAQYTFAASRDNVNLVVAPLFHIGGLNILTLQSFALGSKLVLMRAFDPKAVLAAFTEYKITHMFGAPAMFLFMSQHEDFETTDLSHVETFICGAAPPPESLLTLYDELGVDFCQGYGLTETAPFASFLTPEWSLKKLGSAGQPPIFSELRIVDNDNQVLAAGERGEICIKGPNIMKGYWNRPEATAEAIDTQGWFHSGDVGYLDEDGFLFICDRLKDMVISGGENVYPAEVESVLFKHPAISEVAVIGLNDEKWGEAVTAVAALKDGETLTIEELREFSIQHLAKYKIPIRLHIIAELPRNPAGKVLKYVLKEQLS
ncbi:MAG: fatty-acyl-CoA synthase [Arenicella sp.]|jgi:fatty-acyl-CoA synthase